MNYIFKKLILRGFCMQQLLILPLALLSMTVAADVYISPHKASEQVQYTSAPTVTEAPRVKKSAPQGVSRPPAGINSHPTQRQLAPSGPDRASTEYRSGSVSNLTYGGQSSSADSVGNDVALPDAMELMFPEGVWKVNIDRSIPSNKRVSWRVNGDESPVAALARQNDLVIAVNDREMAVGVSTTREVANHLAHRVPQVWYVNAPSTLRKVVETWAQQAGYTGVQWSPTQDYEVVYPAVITGELKDAMTALLKSVAGERLPLQAEVTPNKVIHIKRGGWQAP